MTEVKKSDVIIPKWALGLHTIVVGAVLMTYFTGTSARSESVSSTLKSHGESISAIQATENARLISEQEFKSYVVREISNVMTEMSSLSKKVDENNDKQNNRFDFTYEKLNRIIENTER